jgi:hypothetical protein
VTAHGSAAIDLVERIAPPLQADLAQDRLADDLAYPRNLVIEAEQRPQRRLLGRRGA